MPGKKKLGSVRSKQEINKLLLETFNALKKEVEFINKKLNAGQGATNEEIRLLKRFPELVKLYQEIELKKEEEVPLWLFAEKQYKFFRMNEIYQEFMKLNDPSLKDSTHLPVLKKKIFQKVLEDAGYYRCWLDGELHKEEDTCPFLLMKQELTKAGVKLDYTEEKVKQLIEKASET